MMKFMKSKVFAVLLVCVLAGMVCTSGSEAAKGQKVVVEITVENVSTRGINIAFAQVNNNNEEVNIIKGWYNMRSGVVLETKTFKPFQYNPNCSYFYYAKAGKGSDVGQSKSLTYEGDDFYGWISKKAFTSKNGQKPVGGEFVGFRELKVSKNGKAKMTFSK